MNKLTALAILGLLCLCPTLFPGWFDSGELVVATDSLGIAHPPGQPLFVLGGKLLTLIPLASIAFRTALFSAISFVIGLSLMGWMAKKTTSESFPKLSDQLLWIFPLVPLAICLHPSLGLQAIRTESYAFQFALSGIFLFLAYLALVNRCWRTFYGSGLVFGLALACHPLLTLVLFPVMVLIAFSLRPHRVQKLGLVVLFVGFGLLAHLYLPLRAEQDPILSWGAVLDWERLSHFLSVRDYRVHFSSAVTERPLGGWFHWLTFELPTLIPLPVLFLAILGLIGVRHHRPTFQFFFVVWLSTLLAWGFKDFEMQNPDAHAYASLAIAWSILLALLGSIFLFARVTSRPSWIASLAAMVFLASMARTLPQGIDALRSHSGLEAEILSRHLDTAPPRSLIHVGSDHWLFPLWARWQTEKRRPDVVVASQGLINTSWYRESLQRNGSRFVRSALLEEIPKDSMMHLSGFLFGNSPGMNFLRKEFGQACRKAMEYDPFDIRATVCAHVVHVAYWQSLQRESPDHALSILEEHLGVESSPLTCPSKQTVHLPYPLKEISPPSFLVDPNVLSTNLVLGYIGCQENQRAIRFLETKVHPTEVNLILLGAYVYWRERNPKEAFALLDPNLFELESDRSLIYLARATLYALADDRKYLLEELKQIGPSLQNHKAVLNLKQRVELKD